MARGTGRSVCTAMGRADAVASRRCRPAVRWYVVGLCRQSAQPGMLPAGAQLLGAFRLTSLTSRFTAPELR